MPPRTLALLDLEVWDPMALEYLHFKVLRFMVKILIRQNLMKL
jgi:hypothetical protein